jgi:capsular polysaccharide biosynthesis protein
LTRAIIAQSIGFNGTYVIPKGAPFLKESLELLGVPTDKIVVSPEQPWSADRLVIPDAIPGCALRSYPALVQDLRERILTACAEKKYPPGPEYIYIARRNPDRPRRVVNELELEKMLEELGVCSVDMCEYSFAEQINLVANAKILIGPSGAGISHSLFMKKNGAVMELFSPQYINPVALIPVHFLAHRYFMLPSYHNSQHYEHGQDIVAFIDIIKLAVQKELGLLSPLLSY